jgi:hypothetical protein
MLRPKLYQRAQYEKAEAAGEAGFGFYLEGEAAGAYPNGSRILKVESEEGDGTPVGVGGRVLASHDVRDVVVPGLDREVSYFYFVKFDDFPHPVGIADWKIGREDSL